MIREYLNRRANFKKSLLATELVGKELESYGYDYWLVKQESEMHFQRNFENLIMHFDIDWHKHKNGQISVDIVGRSSLPTNFGVQPRYYFTVQPNDKL
ncbi:MAG: hypothetical protein ACAH07_06150 [Methylophilaceae bacterium]|nr:hypothetical protein [Methyloradius sp.]